MKPSNRETIMEKIAMFPIDMVSIFGAALILGLFKAVMVFWGEFDDAWQQLIDIYKGN